MWVFAILFLVFYFYLGYRGKKLIDAHKELLREERMKGVFHDAENKE